MTAWLPVKVSAGLFPSERTVQIPTAEGEYSVFVSNHQLDDKRLRVQVLETDDDFALVQVSSQGGLKVAKVPKRELISSIK